ncbi:hypothetical protein HDU86_007790 [Geranomyces michiganensis]|nr:hypothetical protein HDU86_007790 [Geranomyces michiganensis]
MAHNQTAAAAAAAAGGLNQTYYNAQPQQYPQQQQHYPQQAQSPIITHVFIQPSTWRPSGQGSFWGPFFSSAILACCCGPIGLGVLCCSHSPVGRRGVFTGVGVATLIIGIIWLVAGSLGSTSCKNGYHCDDPEFDNGDNVYNANGKSYTCEEWAEKQCGAVRTALSIIGGTWLAVAIACLAVAIGYCVRQRNHNNNSVPVPVVTSQYQQYQQQQPQQPQQYQHNQPLPPQSPQSPQQHQQYQQNQLQQPQPPQQYQQYQQYQHQLPQSPQAPQQQQYQQQLQPQYPQQQYTHYPQQPLQPSDRSVPAQSTFQAPATIETEPSASFPIAYPSPYNTDVPPYSPEDPGIGEAASITGKPVEAWKTTDVTGWLERSNLANLADTFRSNSIDGLAMTQLTEADLQHMGVPVGRIKKFLAARTSLFS